MELRKLSHSYDNTRRLAVAMLVVNIVLTAVLAAGFLIVASSKDRVVLVPPELDERMEIAWNQANEPFHKQWAYYVATLVGNITPHNANYVIEALSKILAPRIYPSVRAKLLSLAKVPAFATGSSLSYFVPARVVYEHATNKTFVIGEYISTTASATGQFEETKQVTWEFEIQVQAGLPMVTHFATYEGATPRTLKWKRANRTQIERDEKARAAEAQQQQLIDAEDNQGD